MLRAGCQLLLAGQAYSPGHPGRTPAPIQLLCSHWFFCRAGLMLSTIKFLQGAPLAWNHFPPLQIKHASKVRMPRPGAEGSVVREGESR